MWLPAVSQPAACRCGSSSSAPTSRPTWHGIPTASRPKRLAQLPCMCCTIHRAWLFGIAHQFIASTAATTALSVYAMQLSYTKLNWRLVRSLCASAISHEVQGDTLPAFDLIESSDTRQRVHAPVTHELILTDTVSSCRTRSFWAHTHQTHLSMPAARFVEPAASMPLAPAIPQARCSHAAHLHHQPHHPLRMHICTPCWKDVNPAGHKPRPSASVVTPAGCSVQAAQRW
jgi:hypothetical protein